MFNFCRLFLSAKTLKRGAVSLLVGLLSNLVLPAGVLAETSYRLPSGELLSDPTRPLNVSRSKAPEAREKNFTVNYILQSGDHKLATINGKKVKEGELVSGARVMRIHHSSVVILVDGQERILKLNKGSGLRKTRH